MLNPSQLLDISDHEEELIRDLIREFMKNAPVLLDNLRDAMDSGDQKRISEQAHQLNGLTANLGGERLLELGLAIEQSARGGRFNPADYDTAPLARELERLQRALMESDWKLLCHCL